MDDGYKDLPPKKSISEAKIGLLFFNIVNTVVAFIFSYVFSIFVFLTSMSLISNSMIIGWILGLALYIGAEAVVFIISRKIAVYRVENFPQSIPETFLKRYSCYIGLIILYYMGLLWTWASAHPIFDSRLGLAIYILYGVFMVIPTILVYWLGNVLVFRAGKVPAATKCIRLIWVLIAALLLAIGALALKEYYMRQYEKDHFVKRQTDESLSAEINYKDYIPFANDNLVTPLDEESTLIIEDNPPRLDGATAFYPTYSALVEMVYRGKVTENIEDTVLCTTTPNAYDNLIDGNTDIIFVLEPSKGHQEKADKKGIQLIKTPIGQEGFVFFVNESNPVSNLTTEQVQKIYAGEIKNWSEVGGSDTDILAFQRPENSGSQTIMLSEVMKDKMIMKPLEELTPAGMGDVLAETATYYNRNNAIGYSFRYYATVMNANSKIKVLSIDGVAPTEENIANGSYPFTVDFYAVTTPEGLENPHTRELINWIISPQGQRLVEKTGYTRVLG